MFRKAITIVFLFSSLIGCAAYDYGYSSLDYEGKLVNLNSEWGKKRLHQIVNYDKSATNLISLGYEPKFLYEVSDDDYYFISEAASYHFERPFLDTNSIITKLTVVPTSIKAEFIKYGIPLPTSATKSTEKHINSSNSPSVTKPVPAIPHQHPMNKKNKSQVIAAKVMTASELFEKRSASVLQIISAQMDSKGVIDPDSLATGSGVVISKHLLVTNYHVIENRNKYVTAESSINGEDTVWRLHKFDKDLDIAILVANEEHHYVNSYQRIDNLKVGQKVYAIGSPEGLKNTLSEGIISGKRPVSDGHVIQTTADITFGSSGGGLFDDKGYLVGITSFGQTGGANLNFAMPMDSVFKVLRKHK